MNSRLVYVVVIGIPLFTMLFTPVVRADETVTFVCSNTPQKLDIEVNDQEIVKWNENSNPAKEFRIEFDKDSTVPGRKSPFKSCFIFCSEKKKISHDSAKKGNKINVKPEDQGKYNYTIHCADGTNIDPIIQIPRVNPPTPHSKP